MVARVASAGEGAWGIVAGSRGVTSVFRAFIDICGGRNRDEGVGGGRKEQHDFTEHNRGYYTALVHVGQRQGVNLRRPLGMSRDMMTAKGKLNVQS